MSITMNPVISGTISEIGYNPTAATLHLRFKTGGLYRYSNVDTSRFAALMAAQSKGKFFNENIKSKHQTTKE